MSEQELRELDIEVAEKVFGIAPREVRPRASAEVVKVWTTNPAILCDGAWEACELKRHGDPPRYSTDIAAAWLVVDAVNRQSGDTLFSVARVRGDWGCRLGGTVAVCHPTAAVAICQAALKRRREKEVLASGTPS